MRQRERARRWRRQACWHRRQRAAERYPQPPDPDDRDRRRQHEPADEERHENAHEAVAPETTGAAAREQHPREEAGDEEEQRHPEGVRGESQHAERQARRAVDHRPESRRQPRQEREAGVEHDTEDEGKRADGIERVQTIVVHEPGRHGSPLSAPGGAARLRVKCASGLTRRRAVGRDAGRRARARSRRAPVRRRSRPARRLSTPRAVLRCSRQSTAWPSAAESRC